jgi:hypothetical protein
MIFSKLELFILQNSGLCGDWGVNANERFKLYEDLYFREVERIEKISARLSLPFTALLAVSTILAFMLNAENKPSIDPWNNIFWILFLASSISLAVGGWFLRMAWFGHYDKLLPTADQMENYNSQLQATYSEYENSTRLVEDSFKKFLFEYYVRFASENAISNDRRSYNIYRALISFTIAIMLSLFAAIPFYLGSNQKEDNISVKQNTTSASASATTEKRQGKQSETVKSSSATTKSTSSPPKIDPNKQISRPL